jgi:hypothetical protein
MRLVFGQPYCLGRAVASIFLSVTVFAVFGCTQKSKVKTISSDDWFRNGVDRLYLATVPSGVTLKESQSVAVGQDVLVGVGCFGEPKDPASLVQVSAPSCSGKKAKIPLNERIRLDDFPMADDSRNPKAGQCVLLLGPSDLIKTIQSNPESLAEGAVATAAMTTAIATNACGLSLALGNAFYLQKTLLNRQSATERGGVEFAKKMLNYFGENNLVPALYANEHPVYAIKSQENLQGKSPEDLAKMDKLQVGQAVLPCSQFNKSIWEMLGLASKSDVRKVFFNAMAEADRRAALRVRQGAYFVEFASAIQRGQMRVAAGIYNPIFAYEFNRNIDAKASQGWGGFGVQKFFDEIRTINKELLAL